MMRSGNPALNKKTFENLTNTSGGVMTLDGAVNKTAISLLLLMCAAYYTYSNGNLSLIWPGFIGGFIVAMITIFKKEWSPVTVPVYAVLEGLALGGISSVYAHEYTGIVQQAIFLTFGIFATLLFAYKTKVIKPTENFKLGVFAATGGIAIVYLASFIMSMFGSGMSIMSPDNSSWMSIGFSLFVVVIASLNLVMDFDFIEEAAESGAPKYMEWYGAFGLLVTLVWLYLEILRLLAKLNGRD
ncbi:MAG: Bax inhibitor-1/YccA family protein [Flavobacteriales bacterium]|nr:Bax inhibitor-1/YccA family protein [Flavobacteriales bacterium]